MTPSGRAAYPILAPEQTFVGGILYPYALDQRGLLVHVADHARGAPATCIGCGGAMVARRGEVRAKHFAHAVATSACDGEGWLHGVAKLLIKRGYRSARAERRPYVLLWRCAGCGAPRRADATRWSKDVALEATTTPGTRSDVAFVGGSHVFVVEVVVAHAPDKAALAAYAAAGVRVFTVTPTSGTLADLDAGIRAAVSHNVDTSRCGGCRDARERRDTAARERAASTARVARVLADLRARRPPNVPQLVAWSRDRRGNEMREYLMRRLSRTGTKLLAAGFTQAHTKPWLFRVRLADDIGTFFADLGGTEGVAMWEDSSPLVYLKKKRCPEPTRVELMRALVDYGERIGVPMRMSFKDPAMWESIE